MDHGADLVPLFTREFELCKVSRDDVVAVLSAPATRPEYASAATVAARTLGASVFEIRVPGMGWDVAPIVKGIVASVPALAKPSPERIFDVRWAATVVEQSLRRPARGMRSAGPASRLRCAQWSAYYGARGCDL